MAIRAVHLVVVFSLETEVKRISNDRLILLVALDHKDLKALTPNALLKGTINASLPPDVFVKANSYKQSWRRIGWMADIFWRQWIRSYLPVLQS